MKQGDFLVPVDVFDDSDPIGVVMRPNPGGGVTATVVKTKDFPALVVCSAQSQWIPGSVETTTLGQVVVLSGGQVVFLPQILAARLEVVSSCEK